MRGEERALPDAPAGVPDTWDEHIELMFDLQVLALRSEITRVISFKTGSDQSNASHPASGVDAGWHAVSHHGNHPDSIMQYLAINSYRLGAFGYLLEKLAETVEGDATSVGEDSDRPRLGNGGSEPPQPQALPAPPDGQGERRPGREHARGDTGGDAHGERVPLSPSRHRASGPEALR